MNQCESMWIIWNSGKTHLTRASLENSNQKVKIFGFLSWGEGKKIHSSTTKFNKIRRLLDFIRSNQFLPIFWSYFQIMDYQPLEGSSSRRRPLLRYILIGIIAVALIAGISTTYQHHVLFPFFFKWLLWRLFLA